jgi:transposase-like protein
MGRRGYPPEFRRKVLDLVMAGSMVTDVARDLGIGDQTIYTWRRQDSIDGGLEPGLSSPEKAELVAAKRRIAHLETELAVHRREAELMKEGSLSMLTPIEFEKTVRWHEIQKRDSTKQGADQSLHQNQGSSV